MSIRLRVLTEVEAREAIERAQPLLKLHFGETAESWAVLEQSYGEGSAEGESFAPIEVY